MHCVLWLDGKMHLKHLFPFLKVQEVMLTSWLYLIVKLILLGRDDSAARRQQISVLLHLGQSVTTNRQDLAFLAVTQITAS